MRLLPLFLCTGILPALAQVSQNQTYKFPQTDEPATPSTPLINTTLTCHHTRYVPREQQCQFALDHCEDYKIGFANYVSFYYCQRTRLVTFFLYSIVLVCLFITLGITASEFLCPNLDTISKFFRMSESLAGVTLLALGNGSPDVFSTLEAIKIDSADLAIGELVGAALFITAVVVGSMAIVKPFKVVARPFIRDVLFLLMAITVTTVFLSDGEISMLEALTMILIYAGYVIFVVLWDWLVTRRRKIQLIDQKVRNHFVDETSRHSLANYEAEENHETNDEDILNDLQNSNAAGIDVLDQQIAKESESSFEEWTKRSMVQRIRPSILSALDLNNRMQDFHDSQGNSAISLDTLPGRPSTMGSQKAASPIKMSSAPIFRDDVNDEEMSANEYEARVSLSAPASYEYFHGDPASFMDPNRIDLFEAQGHLREFIENSNFMKDTGLFFNIFPTLKDISKKPVSQKIMSLISLPAVTLLRLTIPVIPITEGKTIDNDAVFGKGFLLLLCQCIISPFVTSVLIFYDDKLTISLVIFPILISSFLIFLSLTFRKQHKENKGYMVSIFTCCLACCGFIISINWISTIATELIAIIKFLSVFFDLSDAILGLTVFAVGNSLGDFISNFTIARMGFPTMALSACFGAPLLNILLGIGASSLYVIPLTGRNIKVSISKTLIVSGITLYINFFVLLLLVPLNGWHMNKPIGIFMIGLWCFATTLCVIMELLS